MTTATLDRTATTRMVARCRKCRTAHAEDVLTYLLSEFYYFVGVQGGGQEPHRRCKSCGAGLYRWNPVRGKYRADVACNARCTTATGPDCECSCSGHNHGMDNL